MNAITKVFIVLNLLVALACAYTMLVWYAISENWKRRWEQDTRQLSSYIKDANETALQESRARVVAEAVKRRKEAIIVDLEAEIQGKEDDIKRLKDEKAEQRKTISEQSTHIAHQRLQIGNLQTSLEQKQARADQLKTIADAARAVAFELNVSLHELEDDFNNLTMENTRLRETINQLEELNTKQKTYLALCRDNYPEIYGRITAAKPMPPVPLSQVAAVKVNRMNQQHLVMLSIGSENGNVEKGMVFFLMRDGEYICKVRAEKVLSEMTACLVIQNSWNNRDLKIKRGDTATTRIW